MRDDFAALDLFIAAASAKPGKGKKKLLGLPRRKVKKSAQKDEKLASAFKPLIAKIKKKQKSDAVDVASLQGWAISLSWSAPKTDEAGSDASQAYPLHHAS